MTNNENHQSQLTIVEAARWTGKHKRTIQRHVNSGKLQTNEDKQGRKYVDATELMRVYPEDFKSPTEHGKGRQNGKKSLDDTGDNTKLLQERVNMLNIQVNDLKHDKEILTREKTEILDILKQQTLRLPAPKEERKPGFFGRMFGRG